MQLAPSQKRCRMHGMGSSREPHPHPERSCAASRQKRRYSSWGELTIEGDESAQRLKTPTGSVRPARTLQELQGSQTGNHWVGLNLTLNLFREELVPKSDEPSVEPKGERWRRTWVQVQGMGHWVKGNPLLNIEGLFGVQHWARCWLTSSWATRHRNEDRGSWITKGLVKTRD